MVSISSIKGLLEIILYDYIIDYDYDYDYIFDNFFINYDYDYIIDNFKNAPVFKQKNLQSKKAT